MKLKIASLLTVAFVFSPSVFALVPLFDHIDIQPEYSSSTNRWTWNLGTDFEVENPRSVYFPGRDAEYPNGEKDFRPPGAIWDFFGVHSGEPLWIYPEGGSAHAWLGFGDTQAGLTNPVRFKLLEVKGPEGGHFSLYRVISGTPIVFMATADGIGAGDVYPKPQGHHHLNWAFSRRGMWAVKLQVSATRTAGNQPTVVSASDTTRFFFAIGKRAEWRASRFDADTVMDETIGGWKADPDYDGWPNLLEYAFGGNPLANGLTRGTPAVSAAPVQEVITVDNKKYTAISFFRFREPEAAELEYEVQWQSSLAADGWQSGGILQSTEVIDDVWERVVYRDTEEIGQKRRFVRVAVHGLD